MIEARSEASLAGFARLARNCHNAYLIRGEREMISKFWRRYARAGEKPRLICGELFLVQREYLPLPNAVEDLQPATLSDLEEVMKVNAAMAVKEGGTNPLQKDPAGFRKRTARRIDQRRVWVWARDGRVIFKADVTAESPQAAYWEGIHVHPNERLKGHGRRCLSQLSRILLARSQSICDHKSAEQKRASVLFKGGLSIAEPLRNYLSVLGTASLRPRSSFGRSP